MPLLQPHESLPLDRIKFHAAFIYAVNAAVRFVDVPNPGRRKINLQKEDGSIMQLGFTDVPLNRAMEALEERYSDNRDEFISAMWRYWGILDLVRRHQIDEWLKVDPDNPNVTLIHDAVIEAVAVVELSILASFQERSS